MTEIHWLIAQIAVLLAAALQSATGAGLGMVVGPALILTMGSKSAIHVSIILNLSLSVLLLPGETRHIHWTSLKTLALGTIIGTPIGLVLINVLDLTGLKLFAALAISLCGFQLIHSRRKQAASVTPEADSSWALPAASLASGIMASSLAMPGPAALWAMARNRINAIQIRANLRALFVVSYTLALLIHALQGIDWSPVIDASLGLGIALAVGTVIGLVIKRKLSERVLNSLLLGLLLVMGLSLFTKSIMEILENV